MLSKGLAGWPQAQGLWRPGQGAGRACPRGAQGHGRKRPRTPHLLLQAIDLKKQPLSVEEGVNRSPRNKLGVSVLDGVSFTLERGKKPIGGSGGGESGCGKSTTTSGRRVLLTMIETFPPAASFINTGAGMICLSTTRRRRSCVGKIPQIIVSRTCMTAEPA